MCGNSRHLLLLEAHALFIRYADRGKSASRLRRMNVLREKYDNTWLDIYIHTHTHTYAYIPIAARRWEGTKVVCSRDAIRAFMQLVFEMVVPLIFIPFSSFFLFWTLHLSLSSFLSLSLIAFVLHSLAVLFYANVNDTQQFGNSN